MSRIAIDVAPARLAHATPDARRPVLCVFGTRPEAIKMAPVVRALDAQPGVRAVVCVTEQHQEMLDQVLSLFEVVPAYRLGVMQEGQSPSAVASAVLARLPGVLDEVRPAAVLVQGDTTTTFAAALAAFYAGIPVGHVEAGLRTWRKDAPFPEELNRQMTTALAEWHFAPTTWARDNLLADGVAADRIFVPGNPVIDALHWTARRGGVAYPVPVGEGQRIVLVTAHRRESFGEPLAALCAALRDVVRANPDVVVVYPVHPNPEVRGPVQRALGGVERVHLLPPLDYATFVALLARCHLVVTDSGGVQEEGPALAKPVLVVRETTERPEPIEAGTARLVGRSRGRIVAEVERLLHDPAAYVAMARAANPYGDGRAGERIAGVVAGRVGGGAVRVGA